MLFTGLMTAGADEASRTALFTGVLATLAILAALFASGSALARLARDHWLAGLAALGFIGWTLFSAAPLPDSLGRFAHPLWAESGSPIRSVSLAPATTLDGLIPWFAAMAAFLLGALTSPTRESRDWAGRWISVCTLAFAAYALQQFFMHSGEAKMRLDANLLSANAAAALFGALSIASAAMVLRAGDGRLGSASKLPLPQSLMWTSGLLLAPVSAGAMVFALACALLTASRGGLAATIVGFLVLAALLAAHAAGKARSLMAAPLVAILGLAAWVFWRGYGFVADRLSDTADAAEARRRLLEPQWEAFLQRPLFGNGLNTYHQLSSLSATPENWTELSYAGAAHNIYVQALAEVGVVGVSLCAVILGASVVRALWRALFAKTSLQWSAAAFAISVVFLLQGIVDFTLQIPAVGALYGFFLGAFTTRPR